MTYLYPHRGRHHVILAHSNNSSLKSSLPVWTLWLRCCERLPNCSWLMSSTISVWGWNIYPWRTPSLCWRQQILRASPTSSNGHWRYSIVGSGKWEAPCGQRWCSVTTFLLFIAENCQRFSDCRFDWSVPRARCEHLNSAPITRWHPYHYRIRDSRGRSPLAWVCV